MRKSKPEIPPDRHLGKNPSQFLLEDMNRSCVGDSYD